MNILSYFKRQSNNSSDYPSYGSEPTLDIITRLLKELNCTPEFKKSEENTTVEINYQGGNFLIDTNSESAYISILFPGFFETSIDNLNVVRNICNHENIKATVSKLVYSFNEEDNTVVLHIYTGHLLMNEIPHMRDCFKSLLTDNFVLRRRFVDAFNDATDKEGNSNRDIEKERADKDRELFLIREQEVSCQHSPLGRRLNETERLSLGQLLDTLMTLQDVNLTQLKVVTDNLEVINDPQAIREFDLLSPIISEANDKANLIVSYTNTSEEGKRHSLSIDLKSEGETENSAYIRITCCLTPSCIDRTRSMSNHPNKATAYSCLVVFDKKTTKQKQAEFDYMWEDAKDKIKTGKGKTLTDEQRLIVDCISPNIAYNLYRGRNLFLSNRYYEALLHLENAYYRLQSDFHTMNDSQKETFFEICYYIGFCYCELEKFQQAYFFLDIVFNQNNISYMEEYINCLVNSKDFRAILIINNLTSRLVQQIKESGEEPHPNVLSFMDFLRRRKAYAYIDLGQLDEAEKIFTGMLDEEENRDYALNELAYIQQLRAKANNNGDNKPH